jgi:hypothetical protein
MRNEEGKGQYLALLGIVQDFVSIAHFPEALFCCGLGHVRVSVGMGRQGALLVCFTDCAKTKSVHEQTSQRDCQHTFLGGGVRLDTENVIELAVGRGRRWGRHVRK